VSQPILGAIHIRNFYYAVAIARRYGDASVTRVTYLYIRNNLLILRIRSGHVSLAAGPLAIAILSPTTMTVGNRIKQHGCEGRPTPIRTMP